MPIDNREIEPDVVADGHSGNRESAILHIFFKTDAAIAAGGEDSGSLTSEGVNDGSGVDAPATRRVLAGENVRAVVEGEPVHGDRPIDRRIHSQGDDQMIMVAY